MSKSRIILLNSLSVLVLVGGAVLAQGRQFVVQLEALSNQEAALRRVGELRSGGIDAYLVRSEIPARGVVYRVRVGRFPTSAEARRRGQDLQSRNLAESFFVTNWEPPATDLLPERLANRRTESRMTNPPAPENPSSAGPVVAVPAKPVPKSLSAPGAKPATALIADSPRTPSPVPPLERTTPPSASTDSTPISKPVLKETPTNTTPVVRSFVRFSDRAIGYALDRPETWEGGPLDQKETGEQNINAGALFRSPTDGAFLNVIWNPLDQANSGDHDNDLIIELILRSMSSGEGTKQMKETSRRVVTENGQIKTYLDLKAQFESPGRSSMLDFSGKAIVVRCSKGILLVVTFFSNASPADLPVLADRIMASITVP